MNIFLHSSSEPKTSQMGIGLSEQSGILDELTHLKAGLWGFSGFKDAIIILVGLYYCTILIK